MYACTLIEPAALGERSAALHGAHNTWFLLTYNGHFYLHTTVVFAYIRRI